MWTYGTVTLPTGQPELIATDPDHRRRGLVRAQFEVVHDWSRAEGHVWQFINGIAWYYRQFGYAYALDLPPRPVWWLPAGPPATSTDLVVRAATPADVAFLAATEAEATSATTLGARRGEDGFTLELGRRPGGLVSCQVVVIERATGTADGLTEQIGYAAHTRRLNGGLVSLRALELRPGESWLAPTAAVLDHLHGWVRDHPDGPGRGVRLAVPGGHPVLRSAATRLGAGPPGTYGLYVRVPDVAAFLRAVMPELERRLAGSPAVGWSGDLHIDLYKGGLRLHLDDGRVTAVDEWSPAADGGDGVADARLPRDTFLRLLLGSRTAGELEREVADCLLTSDAGALLLDVLFPPMPMSTWEYC